MSTRSASAASVRAADQLRDAYDASVGAWTRGPERVFGAMADALVQRSPRPLEGALAADLGTGSGTVAGALRRAGAQVVALDTSPAMLALCRQNVGAPVLLADVLHLPLRDDAVDIALSGFVLNHLYDPSGALRGMARVVRSGGAVLASVWPGGDEHPVKTATEAALVARGWTRPDWYVRLKEETTPLTDTPAALHAVADAAGLVDVDVHVVGVELGGLAIDDVIAWRLGLAHSAPFVAAMGPAERDELLDDIRNALAGIGQPVVVQMIALSSRVAA